VLGRVVEGAALDELHIGIEDLPSREFGSVSPDRFVLFESTLTNTGAIYRKVAEFPFSNGAAEPEEQDFARPALAGS